jgi:guanosine-3',5'-bis(diphosphate) 3'-pyrophosphohydrolase
MFLFSSLNARLSHYLPREKIDQIARAFLVAADAHEEQFRSSGEPYMTHPVAVSCILADMLMDADTIAAALLHDVVEDTFMTLEQIESQFGSGVSTLVDGVTKLTQIQFKSKAEAQAASFRKMMLAMVGDIRVILIKLADRLHNMKTLGALKPDKRRRIAKETIEVFAPIANRLGMNTLKNDLEELGFAALYPLRYRVLKACVSQARGNRRRLMEKIHRMLVSTLVEEGVSEDRIFGREKRLLSIYKKMRDKQVGFSEIMDVYGFRVVAKDIDDCYRLLGVVHRVFTPIPGRFKDYIAIPKSNGYQSLHTSLFGPYGVPVEIQIRTEAMEHIAENGIAAHWLYKNEGYDVEAFPRENRMKEWFQKVQDMQENAESSLEFIENMKIDLFPEEVYVFTPTGDIIELPRGATLIDFAYSVHTDIGNHCVGAKVNRKLVPLSQNLMNGQTVEIIIDSTAKPLSSWLNFVVTGRAKSAIKHFLKNQYEDESMILGRKLLNYALKRARIDWSKLEEKLKAEVYALFNLKKESELFALIGEGELPSAVVAEEVVHRHQKSVSLAHEAIEKGLEVSSSEGANMTFGSCCHAIPGDEISGLFEKGRGIVVHRSDCYELDELREGLKESKRLKVSTEQGSPMPLSWASEVSGTFPVEIEIECQNIKGIIADIAREVSESGADIDEFFVKEYDKNYGIFLMVIKVNDRKHLADLMRRCRKIRGLMLVKRTISKQSSAERRKKGL